MRAALSLALAVVTNALSVAAAEASGDGTVYLIRHGEKESTKGCLNVTGIARAKQLPHLFDGSKFGTPRYLFAHQYQPEYCARCVDTLTPLANARSLDINNQYGVGGESGDYNEAAVAIRAALATYPTILVAWEHHKLVVLAEALGAPRDRLLEALGASPSTYMQDAWPATDFDTVLELRMVGGTTSLAANLHRHPRLELLYSGPPNPFLEDASDLPACLRQSR